MYIKWKKEQITKEQFKKIAKECREKVKKAEAQNQVMLARGVKNNRKRFFGCIRSKKKSKEVVGLVCGDDGVMVTADRDKAEMFNTFFDSVFS